MDETIGVRELKAHASEILKCVREEGASYTVTHRGRAIARLTPVQADRILDEDEEDLTPYGSVEEMMADMDALIEEIGHYLPEHVDAVEAVREMRRDL